MYCWQSRYCAFSAKSLLTDSYWGLWLSNNILVNGSVDNNPLESRYCIWLAQSIAQEAEMLIPVSIKCWVSYHWAKKKCVHTLSFVSLCSKMLRLLIFLKFYWSQVKLIFLFFLSICLGKSQQKTCMLMIIANLLHSHCGFHIGPVVQSILV